jgi:hypothetical protein
LQRYLLLTKIPKLPNYDFAFFRSGYTLVTADCPKSSGILAVGMVDMHESPIYFRGGYAGLWLHFDHLLTKMVGLANHDIALCGSG